MTASPARRLPLVLAGVLSVLLLSPGSGDSSTHSDAADARILRVGTLFYVDTLNPLVGIETNDTTAYTMVFPQLVQYAPGPKIAGDWASEWSHSSDWLTWTFRLRKGSWSDRVPLTARDAVWTIRTILKYKSGPTSYVASAVEGIKGASAPNPRTLVITYARPIGPVLSNLAQLFILPQHVWSKKTGRNGTGLKEFSPQKELPIVAGGPYTVTRFDQKGTTVFEPNPYFYGPKSNAAAVALTYYTNSTSMTADLRRGNLEFVDALPYGAANALKGQRGVTVTVGPGSEVTNLGFNSNPRKPRNRELLSPRVKEAFEYAVPRRQIVDVVFSGHAEPWANILSPASQASGWLNPAVKPLPHSLAKANRILDALGLERGAGGLRVVPASSGKYAQPRHTMSYGVIVPKDLDFNGERQYDILATAFEKIGVQLNLIPGGDGAQAYELITAPNGTYLKADMYTWYWHPYIDPSFNLSVVTKAEWYNNSDTGFDDPLYDGWWKRQSSLVDFEQRQALVWKMEAYLAKKRPYIQLVVTDSITAHASNWTGFEPTLGGSCKCYFTAPRPTS
jgi:peptide/nickel transport system substrate-binding protein